MEERRRWNRAAKARKKRANVRLAENVPTVQANVSEEAFAAKSGQDSSVLVIADSVALASEAAAGATPSDVGSAHRTCDAGSPRSKKDAGAHREKIDEAAVVAPGLGGQRSTTVASDVAVAAPTQATDNVMGMVDQMIVKLNAKSLALHGEPIEEKRAHSACIAGKRTFTAGHEECR